MKLRNSAYMIKKTIALIKIHSYRDRIPSAASLTVEAALVLPVFIFAVLTFAYLGLLAKTQDEVRHAMVGTVSEASAEAGAGMEKVVASPLYYRAKLGLYLSDTTLTTLLTGSTFLQENDEIDLRVTYTTSLPFSMFGMRPYFHERVHTRAFVGVDKRESSVEDDVVVYVTPTGRVYHRNKNCTYLRMKISRVLYGDVGGLRNSGGGIYYPCQRCAKAAIHADHPVWVTNYGDRYHTNRACSEIKRTIKEILLSQAGSRTPCSKCGAKG